MHVFPDYYKDFRCIGSACRHNCCIGWEIDIDSKSAELYRGVCGELGERLKKSISYEGEPHFILGEGERCPFLNKNNLCDIIIGLGEDKLCSICAEHPRFHNELPGRVETGLGLACEEAARLILTKKTPLRLEGGGESEDEIIALRDRVLDTLTDRSVSLDKRVRKMLSMLNVTFPDRTVAEWADILLSLERLDEAWTKRLLALKNGYSRKSIPLDLENIGEQLLCYFIYRHFANAPTLPDASVRGLFAVLGVKLIFELLVLESCEKESLAIEDVIELCRLYSSEVEYSDENLHTVFDILSPD